MLTGRQLYGGGETVSDSLAAVITKEPEWSALPAATPSHIRRLLERCLRKDPKTRLRDIGEARVLLDERGDREDASAVVPAGARRPWLPWAVAGLIGVGLGIAAGISWQASRPSAPRHLLRLTADIGQGTELAAGSVGHLFAITADGTRLAVVTKGPNGASQLGTRLLRQSAVTPLAGTEGAQTPFFSPDGQWIGFWADSRLKPIAVDGGAPVTLCDAPSLRGASWGDDGNIVASLSTTTGLVRLPASGGKPEPLTQIRTGERTHRWPQLLPKGRAVLFTASDSPAYDSAEIDAVTLATGERKTVLRAVSSAGTCRAATSSTCIKTRSSAPHSTSRASF
jgi:serine/threonine-protein kinase